MSDYGFFSFLSSGLVINFTNSDWFEKVIEATCQTRFVMEILVRRALNKRDDDEIDFFVTAFDYDTGQGLCFMALILYVIVGYSIGLIFTVQGAKKII